MHKSYTEYVEIKISDEVLSRLEKAASRGEDMTYGEAGLFDWLTEKSKEGGWRMVWQAWRFPYVVLEREVIIEETEK